jgi:hypothetical protein
MDHPRSAFRASPAKASLGAGPWRLGGLCAGLACAMVLAACDRNGNKSVPPPVPSTGSSAQASGR